LSYFVTKEMIELKIRLYSKDDNKQINK